MILKPFYLHDTDQYSSIKIEISRDLFNLKILNFSNKFQFTGKKFKKP